MRCFVFLILSISMILAGCVPKEKAATAAGGALKLHIRAVNFPPFDFAREIAGERADITMLLPPASESHSFEPTPHDIIMLQKADVFIYGGGESDSWVDRVLSSINTSNMTLIKMMDVVNVVEEEIVAGMEDMEDEEADGEIEYDEHVWTSPLNAVLIVEAISASLCERDSANADYYRQRTGDYIEKLEALDAGFQSVVNNGKRRTIVFGDRFPFRYFTDRYALEYFAAFPGCSSETEPSAATVAFLIDKVKAEKIPVVFYIELSNERMADIISEATGARKLQLHSGHTLSKKDFESGVTFLELQERNIDAIREALR